MGQPRLRPCGKSRALCVWILRNTATSPPSRSLVRTLDKASQAQLNRGKGWSKFSKQPQYKPLSGGEAGRAIIFAAAPTDSSTISKWKIAAYLEMELYKFLDNSKTVAILAAIREKKTIDDALKTDLTAAINEVKGRTPKRASLQSRERVLVNAQFDRPAVKNIRSVKNTEQITKAMKMVSAAKLRRAQERVIAARPYARI